jgi:hypothetical protein
LACSKKAGDIRVWSTYNTLKVLRDGGEYPDLGASLSVSAARGETEGGQLILTPKKDLAAFDLTLSDLVSADGALFSAENVEVYVQRYIEIKAKTGGQLNAKYPPGYTPDMLLPLSVAEQYGETSVGAGRNQGITVEFAVPSDAAPGAYAGSFTLAADGARFSIPVALTVWDIDVTQSRGRTSIHGAFRGLYGELDNTAEAYREHYETALNLYKYCYDLLPGALDPETLADSAARYWDNPYFTSYEIPTAADSGGAVLRGPLYSYIRTLAERSTPDAVLLEKAYIYPKAIDEPNPAQFSAVRETTLRTYEVEERALADLRQEGFFDELDPAYAARLEASVLRIPLVVTSNRTQALTLGSSVNTYCPQVNQFDTAAQRDLFANLREATADRGGQTWFYTCVEPIYPYPSNHIDDNLIGFRSMRWMQRAYGLEGFLHWSFDIYYSYASYAFLPGWQGTVDPYEEALRFPGANGDGFMIYPGQKYGLDTFLPSIRLTTFRDGQEDYNLLNVLYDLYAEKEAYFGLPAGSFDADKQLKEIYASLFTGAVYNEDDSALYAARERVAAEIAEQRKESRLFVQSSVKDGKAASDIYVAEGYDVSVNGAIPLSEPAGQGKRYRVEQSLETPARLNVGVYKDGVPIESRSYFVSPAMRGVPMSAAAEPLLLSEGSSAAYADGKAAVTLVSGGGTPDERLVFKPYARLSPAVMSPLTETDALYLTVTNDGTEDFAFKVRLAYGFYEYDLSVKITLAPGETRTLLLEKLYAAPVSYLKQAAVEIYADNTDASGGLLPDRRFTVSDVWYSLKEGAV